MNYKEQLRILKEMAEIGARAKGKNLTAEDFAARMEIKNINNWYQLVGDSGKVIEKHIFKFKDAFKEELKVVGATLPGEQMNENQSLVQAIYEDYCERMAAIEKVDTKVIRARILNKATQFSDASDGAHRKG